MAYSPFDLSGKTALITGGNSGIGLGLAVAEAGRPLTISGSLSVNTFLDGHGHILRREGIHHEN